MKKHLYILFLGLVVSFVLVSCADKQETEREIQEVYEFNAQEYLNVNFNQDVLFRYEYKDALTGQQFGWLIDKDGVIRNYDYDDIPQRLNNDQQCSATSLKSLYELSAATDHSIEIEELAAKARLIAPASRGSLSDLHNTDSEDKSTESYFAYLRNYETESSGHSCSGSAANLHVTEDYFDVVLLKRTGHQVQDNHHQYAEELFDWMIEVKNNLQ